MSILYVIGTYRMEHTVPYLSSIIAFRNDRPIVEEDKESLFNAKYPVVEALTRIGNPAIPAMLNNIENSEDPTIRNLSATVIKGVYGIELTRCYLQIAFEKQTDPQKKDRISQTIEKFGHQN